MAVMVDEEKCDGCGTCEEICPVDAIEVSVVARVDPNECVECGSCVDECPSGALSMEE